MNLPESIKIIQSGRVKKGDSPESACRSDRMNAIMDAIVSLARGENIIDGNNIRKRVGGGFVILSGDRDSGRRGGGDNLPFKLTLVPQNAAAGGDPSKFAVQILDGKVNNEWPDVGTVAMGATGGAGYGTLNLDNVANSNIFIRVMFNAKTNVIARLDIYERPNETFPENKITFLLTGDPVPGACDAVDNPDTAPPAGYGALHVLLGFSYIQPATLTSDAVAVVFQSLLGHLHFQFVYGSQNGLPALLPMLSYTDWIKIPLRAP